MFLSIVIPAHNEQARLPSTLQQVAQFVSQQTYSSEVLIVENGSQDRTYQIAQEFAQSHPGFTAIHEPLPGKGRAVRKGILAAQGDYRFMCDADLSMPIDQLNRFLPPTLPVFDLAIGSREAPGAVRYHEPLYRHLGGRLINTLIRQAILPGLHDTQCGFKCFRASAADDLFAMQTLTGWSFDIELLYLARKRGYRIAEIPIDWYFNPESKLNAIHDSVRMMGDIIKIRQNACKGVYNRQT